MWVVVAFILAFIVRDLNSQISILGAFFSWVEDLVTLFLKEFFSGNIYVVSYTFKVFWLRVFLSVKGSPCASAETGRSLPSSSSSSSVSSSSKPPKQVYSAPIIISGRKEDFDYLMRLRKENLLFKVIILDRKENQGFKSYIVYFWEKVDLPCEKPSKVVTVLIIAMDDPDSN